MGKEGEGEGDGDGKGKGEGKGKERNRTCKRSNSRGSHMTTFAVNTFRLRD